MQDKYTKQQIDEIYKNDREYVIHSWSVQSKLNPLVINEAKGIYFYDSNGKEYADMASQLVNSNIGHQHPKVVEAIKKQAEQLCYIAPSFATDSRSTLAKLISEVTPGKLKRTFFTNGGAEANDNAIKIARFFTKKFKIISRYRSYHGATFGGISLTGDPRRIPVEPGIPGIVRVQDPYCYRCPFGQKRETCHLECVKQIEEIIMYENANSIAGIIIEPITGSKGIFVPQKEYIVELRKICDKNNILLIADEVMTGFGRTGEWFGMNNFGVVPDIMTIAKGINSGYVPLGAVVLSERVAANFDTEFLYCGLTYSGHPLACAAAVATINAYKEEKIIENSKARGEEMAKLMQKMKEKHPCIGDARGIGLFGCLELVKNRETKEPIVPWGGTGKVMEDVYKTLMENNVFMYLRWNYMFVAPPLIITSEQLKKAFEVIDKALTVADSYL
jgi:taurine---2-oxoglutarate transaminase